MSLFCKSTERTAVKCSEPDLIRTYLKPVIVYPEKDNKEIFYIDYEECVAERLNRRKYINSFAGDVGVLNIIHKLALNKENAADGRFAMKQGFVDLSGMPTDGEQMAKLMAERNKVWAKLDPELKKNLTYDEFVSTFNLDKLNQYIAAKKAGIEKKESVVDKKEGEE